MSKEKAWRSPWVIYVTITSIISLATFFVGHYTAPLSAQITANAKDITEIKECMKDKPSWSEIKPILVAISEDIKELKEAQKDTVKRIDEAQKEYFRKLEDVYNLLITL